MPLPFFSDESNDLETQYSEEVKQQIDDFINQYKGNIQKELNHAQRIKNYAYLAAAYFTGKTLLAISLNPLIIAVSVVTVAMIPSLSDLDGFRANFNNGLEVENMQKIFSFFAKLCGAGFLAYGVLANYYALKAMTERTYEVIQNQINRYEGRNEPMMFMLPEGWGVVASIVLAIAAFYFIPKRPSR